MKYTNQNSNKYVAKLAVASVINNTSESGTFIVTTASKDGYTLPDGYKRFFLVLDNGTADEEIFRIYRRVGTTLYYDKRLSYPNGKKNHTETSTVQLNDSAEALNELSQHVDDFGFVEEVVGSIPVSVSVKGGYVAYDDASAVATSPIADATIVVGGVVPYALVGNTDNYIVFDPATQTFKSLLFGQLAASGSILLALVTLTAGAIATITDMRRTALVTQVAESISVVSDEAYWATWNGKVWIAPSKNAVYDKIESLSVASPNLKYCFAYASVATPTPDSTSTTLALNTYSTNDAAMSATLGRIILPANWQYMVAGQFLARNAVNGCEGFVRKNGTIIMNAVVESTTSPYTVSVSGMVTGATNDWLDFRVLMNTGTGTGQADGGAEYSYLHVAKIN